MSLQAASYTAGITFTESLAVPGFGTAKHGPVSLTRSGNVPTSVFTKVFAARQSLAAAAGHTFDLTALTDAFGAALAFGHVVYVMVSSADGQPFTFGPGAANPLSWFFDDVTAAIACRANGFVLVGDGDGSGTNQVVDATHKTLLLTNTGAATGNFDVTILGY